MQGLLHLLPLQVLVALPPPKKHFLSGGNKVIGIIYPFPPRILG